MTTNVLFAADPAQWKSYDHPLRTALDEAGVSANVSIELPPETVDYIVYAPSSSVQDFTPFSRAKAVLNLWAGVEDVVGNHTLKIPLARMVDDGLTRGMTEWVTGHVLRHHLGMDAHIKGLDGAWTRSVPPLAPDRRVGILGLGALGLAAARSLQNLGFDVAGWSRSEKTGLGFPAFSGTEGLHQLLQRSDIVVLLLPRTAQTENILNARTLALLPRGSVIINPGRGQLIEDAALLAALDSGALAHATLDVFREEPLPPNHRFWSHPDITVTPHIASETRARTACQVIAENIRRGESGEEFLYLVDRDRGY